VALPAHLAEKDLRPYTKKTIKVFHEKAVRASAMDERREERKLADADAAKERHRVDADAEISWHAKDDWEDPEDQVYESDSDARSVASAPRAPDGEEELNGYQVLEWPGVLYRGYWRENHMHGQGVLQSDAGIYSGDFVMHKITGKGCYHFSNGIIYIGDFADNYFDGQVRFFSPQQRRGREVLAVLTFDGDGDLECAQMTALLCWVALCSQTAVSAVCALKPTQHTGSVISVYAYVVLRSVNIEPTQHTDAVLSV
jgi:hypothetical protein